MAASRRLTATDAQGLTWTLDLATQTWSATNGAKTSSSKEFSRLVEATKRWPAAVAAKQTDTEATLIAWSLKEPFDRAFEATRVRLSEREAGVGRVVKQRRARDLGWNQPSFMDEEHRVYLDPTAITVDQAQALRTAWLAFEHERLHRQAQSALLTAWWTFKPEVTVVWSRGPRRSDPPTPVPLTSDLLAQHTAISQWGTVPEGVPVQALDVDQDLSWGASVRGGLEANGVRVALVMEGPARHPTPTAQVTLLTAPSVVLYEGSWERALSVARAQASSSVDPEAQFWSCSLRSLGASRANVRWPTLMGLDAAVWVQGSTFNSSPSDLMYRGGSRPSVCDAINAETGACVPSHGPALGWLTAQCDTLFRRTGPEDAFVLDQALGLSQEARPPPPSIEASSAPFKGVLLQTLGLGAGAPARKASVAETTEAWSAWLSEQTAQWSQDPGLNAWASRCDHAVAHVTAYLNGVQAPRPTRRHATP